MDAVLVERREEPVVRDEAVLSPFRSVEDQAKSTRTQRNAPTIFATSPGRSSVKWTFTPHPAETVGPGRPWSTARISESNTRPSYARNPKTTSRSKAGALADRHAPDSRWAYLPPGGPGRGHDRDRRLPRVGRAGDLASAGACLGIGDGARSGGRPHGATRMEARLGLRVHLLLDDLLRGRPDLLRGAPRGSPGGRCPASLCDVLSGHEPSGTGEVVRQAQPAEQRRRHRRPGVRERAAGAQPIGDVPHPLRDELPLQPRLGGHHPHRRVLRPRRLPPDPGQGPAPGASAQPRCGPDLRAGGERRCSPSTCAASRSYP